MYDFIPFLMQPVPYATDRNILLGIYLEENMFM